MKRSCCWQRSVVKKHQISRCSTMDEDSSTIEPPAGFGENEISEVESSVAFSLVDDALKLNEVKM